MIQYQLIETTNYLSPSLFYNKFLFWLVRLQPFIEPTGRSPISADKFVRIICQNKKCGREIVTEKIDGKVQCRGCGERTEI